STGADDTPGSSDQNASAPDDVPGTRHLARDSADGHDAFVPGQVMVLGERGGVLAYAESLGFRFIEERRLRALDLSVLVLETPSGLAPGRAIALLHGRLPQLVADKNNLYAPFEPETAQILSLPAPDYARRMINWTGSATCGTGFRVGIVDSPVAVGVA